MLALRDRDVLIRINEALYLNSRLIESVSVPKTGTIRIIMESGKEHDKKPATAEDLDEIVREIRRFTHY